MLLPPASSFSQTADWFWALFFFLNFLRRCILWENLTNTTEPCWRAISGLSGSIGVKVMELQQIRFDSEWEELEVCFACWVLLARRCLKAYSVSAEHSAVSSLLALGPQIVVTWNQDMEGTRSCPLPQTPSQLDHPLLCLMSTPTNNQASEYCYYLLASWRGDDPCWSHHTQRGGFFYYFLKRIACKQS